MTKEAIPHARELLGEASAQLFTNQVLLALVLKHANNGQLTMPIAEIDATGGYILTMSPDYFEQTITLNVHKKS